MKNVFKLIGITAFAVVVGFSMTSCATTTIGGASGDHGLISGLFEPSAVTSDAKEIESYTVILGLFDIGFADYASKVKAAEKSGKKITSVSRNFFGIIGITTAYAK